MKQILYRIGRLFIGLILYSFGIVLTINANLGLSPWDVFHQGIAHITGITMGQASIGVGIALVIIDAIFGERLGWGTLCNMLFIGIFMDILMLNHLIPMSLSVTSGVFMMLIGMIVIGFATYFYLGAGFGSGPRDGLMVAITKKTKKSVGFVRNFIEISALGVGFLLGGFVGIGTLIMALTLGYIIQVVFKVMRFDMNSVKHRFIDEDYKLLKDKLCNRELSKVEKKEAKI